MKKLLLILVALVQVTFALAQSFPVRVTPQAITPYPTNLSGYANSGLMNSPLRVQLVLSDVTASSREVRLAVSIEGNGINATSAPVVVSAPTLILDGGIPLNLTIAELAPYFEQQNLQGLSSVQYNNPLADGTYRFCFEVFDAFNGNRLSSKSCATIFLINNDPPFLNKPDNESKISEQNPTNLIFQWTPRHINVPNVSYEFSIVEVWDPYIDPQAIFLSSPPLYQEITTNTSLLYGPIQPLLLAGKRYAWRIRAFATNNGEEVSVFNNNGNSEVFWFDYQGNCELPTNIEVQDVSMTNATISWISHPEHLDYTVQYREAGSTRWYRKTTPRDYVTIDEFKPDTVYEYRIVGNCTENSFGESPVDTFRTLSEELAEYTNCGIDPDPVDLSNQELLTELFVNDVFTAGDFPVYVKEVSGSGSFSGEGYISTPWLATVRIPIKFQNIKINTDMKLVDGFVVTTYDPNWGSIVDADVIIDTITGDDGDTQEITVDIDIVEIQINDNGDIILIGEDGTVSDPIPGGNDILFHDNNNEDWFVDADGNVTKDEQADGGSATTGNTNGIGNGGVNEITASGVTVTFNNTNGFYSFDELPKNAGGTIANQYHKVPISGSGEYDIPYKAIAKLSDHPSDFLTAEISFSNNDHTASDIIFKTKEGTKIQAAWNTDSTVATLSLRKKFDFAKQQIIAAVKPKDSTAKYTIAGAANLWHLSNQEVNDVSVTIIPVNNVSVSNNIAQEINAIYNPAGVNFNVTVGNRLNIDQSVWDLNNNGQLDVGDSSLLAQYTEEERAINAYFKTQTNYNNKTYYIFVTDLTTTDSATSGFMPLKRQYGFIFDQNNVARTIAHELGHGVFGLEHPFTEYNTTGTTNLLMDYGTGTVLNHMDWEKLHAPGIQIYWFQGDEDGELGGEIWFTPSWKAVQIKRSSTIVTTSKSTQIKGALPGFKVDGIRYTALFSSSGNFSGYYEGGKATGKKYEISSINEQDIDKVYLFVKGEDNCNKAYEATYEYAIANKTSIVYDDNNNNIKDSGRIKCASCPDGKQFIEDYVNTVDDTFEKDAIYSIAALICAEGDDKIDYDILVSQIFKDNADYIGNMFWLSDKAVYRRALEHFWNKDNPQAFSSYLYGLQLVTKNIKKYHEKLGNDQLTKEELYAGLFYLNDNFLSSLELQQKKDLLKLVFDHNSWWIGENIFNPEKSDRSLIRKLISTISDSELPEFVKEVGTDSGDRDRLLYIGYELTIDQFSLFSIEERLKILKIILNGAVLDNWSGTHSTEDLVLNIIDSIESDKVDDFLTGLVSSEYTVGNDLLYKQLVDKLDNSFIGDDVNRLSLVTKLAELAFIKNGITPGSNTTITDNNDYQSLLNDAQCKASYYWNVKNERFLWVFNVVNDQSNLEFSFTDNQKKINLKQDCTETSTQYYGGHYSEKICVKWDTNETFDPFELVAIEIINDITFTKNSGACENNNAVVCGEIALVPAMFIDYLIRTKDNTRIQNGVFNTLTVASFYFSGSTVIAARGAFSAATFTAYADLFVTIVNPYFSDDELFISHATSTIKDVFGTDEDKAKEVAKMLQTAWTVGTIPLTIDTASSIPNPDKHIKAVAAYKALVRRVGKDKARKIIAQDPKLADEVIEGLEEASKNMEQSSDASRKLDQETENFSNQIDNQLGAVGNYGEILKNSVLDLLPQNSKLRASINQLDASEHQSLISKIFDLDPTNNGGTNLISDFDNIITEIVNPNELDKLLKAWKVLIKKSPQIAKIPENSKILAKVSDRFMYNNENGFDGLYKLFNEGSQIGSKQKLIDGLKEADNLFEESLELPIQFSAIKKGEVTVNDAIKIVDKYGRGEEVARYVDGVLQKKKVIPDGDGVKVMKQGNSPEDDILQKGEDVGFREIDNTVNLTSYQNITSKLDDIDRISPGLKQKFIDNFIGIDNNLLNRIDENPEFVEIWANYTPEAQKLLKDNIDFSLKHLEGRSLLIEGKYDEYANLFGETIRSNNKGYIDLNMTDDIIEKASQIANKTDDVPKISQYTKIREEIIREVKEHYWIKEHLVKTENGLIKGRFAKFERDIAIWEMAEEGFKNPKKYLEDGAEITIDINSGIKEFKNLIAHEYVELKLMKKGLGFSSVKIPNKGTPFDFGAHDLAPTFNDFKYFSNGRNINPPTIEKENLSNLDEVVKTLINIYGL